MPATSGSAAMTATPISTAAATMTSSASTSTSCGIVSRVPLRLGRQTYDDTRLLVMAIVNRTPDSFYDKGATYDDQAALAAVARAVDEGADIVDVVADVLSTVVGLAERAVAAGVPRESVLIDPGHDFGKNTWHSLELTRRLGELVDTGWPVLVSVSNKDFVGESLDRAVPDRLVGTLAATSVCAWLGARVFRAHNVRETRDTLDMVATIRGDRLPAATRRGLA